MSLRTPYTEYLKTESQKIKTSIKYCCCCKKSHNAGNNINDENNKNNEEKKQIDRILKKYGKNS